jgi:hypothetical protein
MRPGLVWRRQLAASGLELGPRLRCGRPVALGATRRPLLRAFLGCSRRDSIRPARAHQARADQGSLHPLRTARRSGYSVSHVLYSACVPCTWTSHVTDDCTVVHLLRRLVDPQTPCLSRVDAAWLLCVCVCANRYQSFRSSDVIAQDEILSLLPGVGHTGPRPFNSGWYRGLRGLAGAVSYTALLRTWTPLTHHEAPLSMRAAAATVRAHSID